VLLPLTITEILAQMLQLQQAEMPVRQRLAAFCRPVQVLAQVLQAQPQQAQFQAETLKLRFYKGATVLLVEREEQAALRKLVQQQDHYLLLSQLYLCILLKLQKTLG
jgi:hypothetical protein